MTDTNPGRAFMDALAEALTKAEALPPSREASMAKTKLDEAIMWGSRAIGARASTRT